MIETQFNAFDAIILGIMGLSMLIAFFRGLVREVLSLATWVGAGVVTLYMFPRSLDFVKAHVKSVESKEAVAALMAGVGTFVLMLVLFSILVSIIMRYVKASNEVGVIDNVLGLLFGAARGAFMVALGYLLYSVTLPENRDDYPQWLKEAKTAPFAEQGADLLRQAAPKYIADMQKDVKDAQERAAQERTNIQEEIRDEADEHRDVPITFEPLRQENP